MSAPSAKAICFANFRKKPVSGHSTQVPRKCGFCGLSGHMQSSCDFKAELGPCVSHQDRIHGRLKDWLQAIAATGTLLTPTGTLSSMLQFNCARVLGRAPESQGGAVVVGAFTSILTSTDMLSISVPVEELLAWKGQLFIPHDLRDLHGLWCWTVKSSINEKKKRVGKGGA